MTWEIAPSLGSFSPQIPHASGRFYGYPAQTDATTFTVVLNTLYATPFCAPTPVTYTSIVIEVTTLAAGASMRLGIYRDNGGVPGALGLDGGTVSVGTTGAKSISIS